jgi:hypothetical protein
VFTIGKSRNFIAALCTSANTFIRITHGRIMHALEQGLQIVAAVTVTACCRIREYYKLWVLTF